jgi:hypothetical protein
MLRSNLVLVLDAGGGLMPGIELLSRQIGLLTHMELLSYSSVESLQKTSPIALVCGRIESDAPLLPYIINCIHGYDPSLPVLLITEDDPTIMGTLDMSRKLWPLENFVHASKPTTHEIIAFLASAARRTGKMGLMRI